MFYSPLRYPGGKGKLASLMELLVKNTGHAGGTYIEPFAGGAAIALELLEKEVVKNIVINDFDRGVYSFWRAILDETDRFLYDIWNVELTIDEWRKNRYILNNYDGYSYELGFATFYLNRTNRSGIVKGGVIGGISQSGAWKIDARFNRKNLSDRIKSIANKKERIHLYNEDVNAFVQKYLPLYQNNAFVYFDPPYYEKGKQLYLNFFSHEDHVRIEKMISNHIFCDWVITYDDVQEIENIYCNHIIRRFDLNYSAARKRKASEIIIFKKLAMVPSHLQMEQNRIFINLR